jgi:hypothetical protein
MEKRTPRGVKEAIVSGAIILALAGILGWDAHRNRKLDEQTHNTLYEQTSESIAHLDGQVGTSHTDWARAYTEILGRHYDFHNSNPRELTNSELQTIMQFRKESEYSNQ